jgi:hypothetical protein
MSINPADIDLTPEQRVRLAELAEKAGKQWNVIVDELLDAAPRALQSQSAANANGESLMVRTLYDVLLERGILGCFDGPSDLSTNPEHMEGFGESRRAKSTD